MLPLLVTASVAQDPSGGLAKTPPMGWMSWQAFRCEVDCARHPYSCINEDLYKSTALAMKEGGYVEAGYVGVHIDDCWEGTQPERDSAGKLYPNPQRFPSGMQSLSRYMQSLGASLGIYSDEGTKTCGGYPGSKGYEEIDAKTFEEWEIDYLKLDGCYNSGQGYPDGYAAFGKALRALSRPIVYSCSWPAYLGGNETAKPFDKMISAGCNLWRNWDDIQCSWGSLSSIIEHWGEFSEALEPVARPGHWNDPDMLLIGATKPDGSPCVSLEEERTQMAIWALTASPLIMGNDARNITENSREILLNKGAIAVDQDALGVPGKRLVAGAQQIWSRPLGCDSPGCDVAVGFYNYGGKTPPPIPTGPCDTWAHTQGSYYEATGGGEGNVGEFSDLTPAQAQAACCANPKCAGFSISNSGPRGSGFYKRDAQAGLTPNAGYDGYTKPSQVPSSAGSAVDITVQLSLLGFQYAVNVTDVWTGTHLGVHTGSFTAKAVAFHDTAFVKMSQGK